MVFWPDTRVTLTSNQSIGRAQKTRRLFVPCSSRWKKKSLSNGTAYASFAVSVSPWIGLGLSNLPAPILSRLPGWGWVLKQPGWHWALFEALGLFLGIAATLLRSKLWPIVLPLGFLTFLFTMYVMGS